MRILYNLLAYLLQIPAAVYWLVRAIGNSTYRDGFGQRFGFGYPKFSRCIWIHAVSVGEVQAAAPLIRQVCERYPDKQVLITTVTPTGAAHVRALFGDTVAHSYFVPFKMIRTFNTVMLKHTYWEVRVEACVDEKTWLLAREIAQKNFNVNDTMMRQVLSNTIFSFGTNKRIFNSLLLLNRLQQWQKMIRSLSTNSKWTLPEDNLNEYLSLAHEAVFSVLSDPESPYLQADPTGARSLNAARILRKNLKILWQSGKLSETEIESYLEELRPRFRQGILRQKQILELLSDDI